MSLNVKKLVSVLAVLAAVAGVNSQAKAQSTADAQFQRPQTTADRFQELFYSNDKPFFENRSIIRQLDTIFGIGSFKNSFVENEIHADTQAIHEFYVEALANQVSSDPVVRTRDLPNPYETSILQSPRIDVNQSLIQMLQNQ